MAKVIPLNRNAGSKARTIEALMMEPIAVEDPVVYSTETPRNTATLALQIKRAAERARLRDSFVRDNSTRTFAWVEFKTNRHIVGGPAEFFDACVGGKVRWGEWIRLEVDATK